MIKRTIEGKFLNCEFFSPKKRVWCGLTAETSAIKAKHRVALEGTFFKVSFLNFDNLIITKFLVINKLPHSSEVALRGYSLHLINVRNRHAGS